VLRGGVQSSEANTPRRGEMPEDDEEPAAPPVDAPTAPAVEEVRKADAIPLLPSHRAAPQRLCPAPPPLPVLAEGEAAEESPRLWHPPPCPGR
jgi:hypothetical protein